MAFSSLFCFVYTWVDLGHLLGHQLDGLPHLGTNAANFLGWELEADVVLIDMRGQLNGVGQVYSLEDGPLHGHSSYLPPIWD